LRFDIGHCRKCPEVIGRFPGNDKRQIIYGK
jgi:hypothetical protein